jgi:sugar/nucleoside kinase (ribokinase family)
MTFDALVAGEINPDLILSGDVVPRFGQVEQLLEGASLRTGSSAAIFACGAARLGLSTAFVGLCGDDVFGRFMLGELQRRDVNIEPVIVRPDRSTGVSIILNKGADRAILTFPGLIPELRGSDITDELLRQCRHLHVASYYLQANLMPDLPSVFERAHRLGLTTSIDPNYDPSEEWKQLQNLLPFTDVLLLNEREAAAISGKNDVEGAGAFLASRVGTLAIKLGAEGAFGIRDGERSRVPSPRVNVVDTVGAGDSFDAGFIYAWLNQWDLQRSLLLGCACGALSTGMPGGTEGQPTLEAALKHVPG